MSVYKIDTQLPTTTKISTLNDMVIEVNGKSAQGQFDKNELTQLYTDLGMNRQFLRDISIGHAITDYTGWTHLKAETGYSIWKKALSDYSYNALNEMYMDDMLLSFKGQAGAETALTFAAVFTYDGVLYNDHTIEAGTEGGTAFNVTQTYLYMGTTSKFGGFSIEFETRGSNYTLKVEYFNGSWVELTAANGLVDNTNNFESDGTVTWTPPTGWIEGTVGAVTQFWIRVSTTTTPVVTAKSWFLIPYNSVIALLSLSSQQVTNEEWAWCSYGQNVYTTIRNTGQSAYEGDYFLTSASSDTNKRNFFIYNHEFKMNYQDFNFNGISMTMESGVSIGDLVYISDQYTFNLANGSSYAKRAIGVHVAPSIVKFVSGLVQRVNTVGAGNIQPGNILYLSTTPGKVSKTAPSGTGQIQQIVGTAISYETSGNVVDMIMHTDVKPTIL